MQIVKNFPNMHYLLYFFAIFCLSQSAHWVKWSGAAVAMLGFWRLLFAGLLWIPFVKVRHWQSLHRELPSKIRIWTLGAGFLLFLHLWTFQYAAQHTRIANLMILFASSPLSTALLTVAFFAERLTLRLIIAYLISLSGILYLVYNQIQFDESTLIGDMMAVGSAILYSGYLICSRQARAVLPNSLFSVILFLSASMLFGISCWVNGVELMPPDHRAWVAIGGLTLMSTILGHSAFAYLLKYLNINWMSCGKLLEPILAAMTAYFLFDEAVPASTWISFFLTGTGVLLLFLKRKPVKFVGPQEQ